MYINYKSFPFLIHKRFFLSISRNIYNSQVLLCSKIKGIPNAFHFYNKIFQRMFTWLSVFLVGIGDWVTIPCWNTKNFITTFFKINWSLAYSQILIVKNIYIVEIQYSGIYKKIINDVMHYMHLFPFWCWFPRFPKQPLCK